MSEQQPKGAQTAEGNADEGAALKIGEGTDVAGADADGGSGDVPATSDPEQFTEDSTLGGTGGQNAGGAG